MTLDNTPPGMDEILREGSVGSLEFYFDQLGLISVPMIILTIFVSSSLVILSVKHQQNIDRYISWVFSISMLSSGWILLHTANKIIRGVHHISHLSMQRSLELELKNLINNTFCIKILGALLIYVAVCTIIARWIAKRKRVL